MKAWIGWILLLVSIVLLESCKHKSFSQYAAWKARGEYVLALTNIRSSTPTYQGIEGRVIVSVNDNPIDIVDDSAGISLNEFLQKGTNQISVVGQHVCPFEVLIYGENHGGETKLGDQLSLFGKMQIPSEPDAATLHTIEFDANVSCNLPFYAAQNFQPSRQEIESALRENLADLASQLKNHEWSEAAKITLEGKQIYRQLYRWSDKDLQRKLDETAAILSNHVNDEILFQESNIRFVHGKTMVLVYGEADGRLQGLIRAKTTTGEEVTILPKIRYVNVDGKWIIWSHFDLDDGGK